MRFVVVSDVHAHNWSACSTTTNGLNSRLLDTTLELTRVRQHMLHYGIKYIVNCGDLFHVRGKPPTEAVNLMLANAKSLKKQGAEQFYLRGNHDTSLESKHHSLEPFKEYGLVIDKPMRFKIEDTECVGIPYCVTIEELEEGLKLVRPKTKLLFMHQGVHGVPLRSGYIPGEMMKPSLLPKSTLLNILGHYHEYQWINKNSLYVGSLTQHNWGDEGIGKYFLEVRIRIPPDELLEVNEQLTRAPQFKTLYEGSLLKGFDIQNNFCRFHLYQSISHRASEIRDTLMSNGARHVEFVIIPDTEKMSTAKMKSGMVGKKTIRKFVKGADTILDRKALSKLGGDILDQVRADGDS